MDQNYTILFGITIVIIILVMSYQTKSSLVNCHKDILTGMWSSKDDENFLYIDQDKKTKNGYNRGYIVRGDKSAPINVKVTFIADNKVKLKFDGEGCNLIKNDNNALIDFNKGKILLEDFNNKKLILEKECSSD